MNIDKYSSNNLPWVFSFFLISISLTIIIFLAINGFKIPESEKNIVFYIIQVITVVVLFYLYINSIRTVDALEDISIRPADIIIKNVDEKVVQNIIGKAIATLLTCRNLWFTIILGWILLYTFLMIYSLGYVDISVEIKNFSLRVLNYVDTVQMLFMYTLFSTSDPNINMISVIKRNKILLISVFILIICDIFCVVISHYFSVNFFKISLLDESFALIGALLSSVAFLMFFSRLDSILIQLNKFFLSILILYGILQSVFPLILANFLTSDAQNLILMSIGLIVFGCAKISLGLLFSQKKYLERLIYYFTSLYFIGPITNKRLSVGHTFYISNDEK